MKTLTITKARQNLGEWVSRAVKGKDIGIIDSGSGAIIALRRSRFTARITRLASAD